MPDDTTPTHPLSARTAMLGPGAPSVTRLALGTMTFGVETAEQAAFAQLDHYVEQGGTFIDTADVYGSGESERIVGRWLADRGHDHLVIATKGRFGAPAGAPGASRRELRRAVAGSLSRLGLDALDVYFVHGWDEQTPIEDTLDTLTALVRAGTIHQVGWSNVTGWQLQRIITTARLGGYVVPTVLQPQYNLLDRGIELEVLPVCLEESVALTPWSPLAGGWLTGKYSPDSRPAGATRLGEDPDRGVEAYDTRNTDRTWRILDTVTSIAERYGRPPAHVALAWLLTRPGVASVLLGARTAEQLSQTLGAVGLTLEDDDTQALTRVSDPGLPPYPYGMVEDFCQLGHWQRLGIRPGTRTAPSGGDH
ncbi:aldo/keto reductase [Nocardioides ferulae]|uniref:aldo/keto reductase n=1 Tax=Nocardioides ferulae TaxID=2340821 RepID=UPI001F0CD3AB|nr:aldo/keto reductase [Nocardioides ferulae]